MWYASYRYADFTARERRCQIDTPRTLPTLPILEAKLATPVIDMPTTPHIVPLQSSSGVGSAWKSQRTLGSGVLYLIALNWMDLQTVS
jgi:hypothetical protein